MMATRKTENLVHGSHGNGREERRCCATWHGWHPFSCLGFLVDIDTDVHVQAWLALPSCSLGVQVDGCREDIISTSAWWIRYIQCTPWASLMAENNRQEAIHVCVHQLSTHSGGLKICAKIYSAKSFPPCINCAKSFSLCTKCAKRFPPCIKFAKNSSPLCIKCARIPCYALNVEIISHHASKVLKVSRLASNVLKFSPHASSKIFHIMHQVKFSRHASSKIFPPCIKCAKFFPPCIKCAKIFLPCIMCAKNFLPCIKYGGKFSHHASRVPKFSHHA